jgi:hypothetical protein
VAAPLITDIYGLAGNAARISPGSIYEHQRQLFDITAGSNALFASPSATCGDDYLCVAKNGYDARPVWAPPTEPAHSDTGARSCRRWSWPTSIRG